MHAERVSPLRCALDRADQLIGQAQPRCAPTRSTIPQRKPEESVAGPARAPGRRLQLPLQRHPGHGRPARRAGRVKPPWWTLLVLLVVTAFAFGFGVMAWLRSASPNDDAAAPLSGIAASLRCAARYATSGPGRTRNPTQGRAGSWSPGSAGCPPRRAEPAPGCGTCAPASPTRSRRGRPPSQEPSLPRS